MNEPKRLALQILGLTVMAVGVVSAVGNLAGFTTLTTWGVGAGMAFPTALCFVSIGAAFMIVEPK